MKSVSKVSGVLAFLCLFSLTGVVFEARADSDLPPLKESTAYDQYVKRPPSELSKLIFLMDRFKGSDFHILYEGVDYDSRRASVEAKKYLAKHYKDGDAEAFVKAHCYRSEHGGEIILLKYPDGRTRPLRDVLIEELEHLKEVS